MVSKVVCIVLIIVNQSVPSELGWVRVPIHAGYYTLKWEICNKKLENAMKNVLEVLEKLK